jgi:hypothetical protein
MGGLSKKSPKLRRRRRRRRRKRKRRRRRRIRRDYWVLIHFKITNGISIGNYVENLTPKQC